MNYVKKLYSNSTGQTRPLQKAAARTTTINQKPGGKNWPSNRNRHATSTWDVITVTGRTDTSSSEKPYLNKSFTTTVVELSASVDEEFNNIINLKKAN
jgi:hypothetical protein